MKISHADPIFALKIITKLKAQQGKPADIFELSAFSFELTRNKNGIIPKSRVKSIFTTPASGYPRKIWESFGIYPELIGTSKISTAPASPA